MEHVKRDTVQSAAPQNDWQDAKPIALVDESTTEENELSSVTGYGAKADERLNFLSSNDDPDPDDDDDDDEDDDDNDDNDDEDEDDEAGDWGHVDPAESNGPFPDPNEPGFPGSAV